MYDELEIRMHYRKQKMTNAKKLDTFDPAWPAYFPAKYYDPSLTSSFCLFFFQRIEVLLKKKEYSVCKINKTQRHGQTENVKRYKCLKRRETYTYIYCLF